MCTPLSATSQLVAFLLCPNKLWFNPGVLSWIKTFSVVSFRHVFLAKSDLRHDASRVTHPTSENGLCVTGGVTQADLMWPGSVCYMPGSFSILYLRDVSALVASLQQTGNEIPKEIQVLFWQGFLQLLDTEDTVNQHVKKLQALSKR